MNIKEYKPTSWSIDNRTTIYVFTLFITIAGILTYISLPKERFPDVVVPNIIVSTIYPGTSPSDMENLITKPLEKQMKGINGVKKIKSNSIQDFSAITVEFNTGITPADAKQKVRDAVDKALNDLPDDLDKDPMIQEVDLNEVPIMNINLVGNFSQENLKRFAEDLEDDIETIKQITRVDIIGSLDREVQVNVNLYRMQANNITFQDIENAVRSQNVNISGGDLNVNDVRRTLRIAGEFKDIQSMRNLIIRGSRGNAVMLSEIAEVKDGYAEKQNYARLDNKNVITLNVIKRAGENLIEASDRIQEIVKDKQENEYPQGLDITITGDTSEETRVTLNDLINTVILGFIFVVFILMFFMGTTNAIFVGLSVPLSTLLALILMPGLDYTLNMIVLFSLLLALGIVVDDAIVVIENTHRLFHKHKHWGIEKAAKAAAGEVFIPVLSGTLTTIAPFVPLLFWPGIVGEFMKFLPVTLIITLFASLFVAFIMNPVFAVSFMDTGHDEHSKKKSFLQEHGKAIIILSGLTVVFYFIGFGWGNFMATIFALYFINHFVFTPMINGFQNGLLPRLMNGYRNVLKWAIQGGRPVGLLIGTLGLLIGTFFIFGAFNPGVNFFPSGDPNFVFVYNRMPIGTDAAVTDSVTKVIEKSVFKVIGKNNPAVKSVISNVGIGAGDPQSPDLVVTPHKSKVTVAFVPYGERNGVSTQEILDNIRKEIKGIPGAEISVEKEANGPPTGKPINVEISGDDLVQLDKLSILIKDKIAQSGIQGIEELKSDLQLNKPEIVIDIDREKAQREGIGTVSIALAIRTALYGREVSKYREEKDDFPIMVRLQESDRATIDNLMAMNIGYLDMTTGGFRNVPLSAVATAKYATSYSSINRKNQKRVVNLASNVLTGYNANEIVGQIDGLLKTMDLPNGYTAKMTGEQEDQEETGNFLVFAFGGCLLLMLIILVAQFNSVSKPLIIFSTVVLSLIGVLLGFVIFQKEFSVVMTGVGIIALAGIVVKNGILLIEFTDELRSRGVPLRQAIIEAGATRLTPVLLTASAAILGLIPLAIGMNINFGTLFTHGDPEFYTGGDNAVFWGPLAWAIIYGLTFCTFLTLVMVPCQYWVAETIKYRIKGKSVKEELEKPFIDVSSLI